MKLKYKDLSKILFLDIETVPESPDYLGLDSKKQNLWARKAIYMKSNMLRESDVLDDELLYFEKAGIYAEFGKIVCISMGILVQNGDSFKLRIKSFSGNDEKALLNSFADLLNKHYPNKNKYYLCGHNIKEFDVPFICRRMLINDIELPKILELRGLKPWQTEHVLDTMQLWRFGDYKNFTSLDLLTNVFGIASPKHEMDGSQVATVFYNEKDTDKIETYCESDVVALVKVFLKLLGFKTKIELE